MFQNDRFFVLFLVKFKIKLNETTFSIKTNNFFRSMDKLTNFVGAQDIYDIASGVMGFSSSGFGHEVITKCLIDLVDNFRGDLWGNNGPGLITRVLRNVCNVRSVR